VPSGRKYDEVAEEDLNAYSFMNSGSRNGVP
jgi:hypothetical protein